MQQRGVDIREMTSLLIRAYLANSANEPVDDTDDNAALRLYEIQPSGSVLAFDFGDGTFKPSGHGQNETDMAYQLDGLWTYSLGDLGGFTAGRIYVQRISHPDASPPVQVREFQVGDGVLVQSETTADLAAIQQEQGEQGDTLSAMQGVLNSIAAGDVEMQLPVSPGGKDVEVVRGDDYTIGSPHGPVRLKPKGGDDAWPDMSGAAIVMTARSRSDDKVVLQAIGSVENPAGPNKVIVLPIPRTQTSKLPITPDGVTHKFDVQVTMPNGDVWTPVDKGRLRVIEDQTR